MPKETTDSYTYAWEWDFESPNERDFDGRWAEVYDLNVFDKSKRGERLGSQIIGSIMNKVRSQGGERLYVMIGSRSDGSAVFLQKNGFEGIERWGPDGVTGYVNLD